MPRRPAEDALPDPDGPALTLQPRDTAEVEAPGSPPGSDASPQDPAPDPSPQDPAPDPSPQDPAPVTSPTVRPATVAREPSVPLPSTWTPDKARRVWVAGVSTLSVGSTTLASALVLHILAKVSQRKFENFPRGNDDDAFVEATWPETRKFADRGRALFFGAGIAYAVSFLAIPVGAALLVTHSARSTPQTRRRGLRLRAAVASPRRGGS